MSKFTNQGSLVYRCPNQGQVRAAVQADPLQNPPVIGVAGDSGNDHLIWALGWGAGSTVPAIPTCPKCGATLVPVGGGGSDNDLAKIQVQVGNSENNGNH